MAIYRGPKGEFPEGTDMAISTSTLSELLKFCRPYITVVKTESHSVTLQVDLIDSNGSKVVSFERIKCHEGSVIDLDIDKINFSFTVA